MSGFPSIFKDVIGPIICGPSSSHCAGALRVGRICRDLMGGEINQVRFHTPPEKTILQDLASMKGVRLLRNIRPVLPVLSRKDMDVPFLTTGEMLESNCDRGLPLWKLAMQNSLRMICDPIAKRVEAPCLGKNVMAARKIEDEMKN